MKVDERNQKLYRMLEETTKQLFIEKKQTAWPIEDEVFSIGRALKTYLCDGSNDSLNKLVQKHNNAIAESKNPQSPTPFQRALLTIIKIELENEGKNVN
jgi:hypothetical protein